MSRIPTLKPEQMDAEQRRVYEETLAKTGRASGGPSTGYAYAPLLWERNNAISAYLETKSSLSPAQLRIGALVTHTAIESSTLVAEQAPLLAMAVPHIAHRAIRNSGTWGGSIAYGDPAAEWPCCLVALDGAVTVQGPGGTRRIAATDFFQDLYTTALQPDEVITGADVPVVARGDWFGFDELSRRHGDYAVAGLAVAAHFDGAVAQRVQLGFLGVGATPVRARRTEALLNGKVLDAAAIEIAAATLKTELDPVADLTHSGETKRHLATVLMRRLLTAALAGRSALAA